MIPRHFQIAIGLLLLSILLIGISLTRMPEQSPASTQLGPAAPPVAGKQEQVRVLVAYDYDQALRWRDAEAFMPEDRGLRAGEAVRSILSQYLQSPSPHPLGKGADVKDVYSTGNATLAVDMTPPFAHDHPSVALSKQLPLVSS